MRLRILGTLTKNPVLEIGAEGVREVITLSQLSVEYNKIFGTSISIGDAQDSKIVSSSVTSLALCIPLPRLKKNKIE